MSQIQTKQKTVGNSGAVQVTAADRCKIASAVVIQPGTGVKTAIRNGVLRKRSRLLVRNHQEANPKTLLIGGDGVSTSSYPLVFGESIDLLVSPTVLVYSVLGLAAINNVEMRTLETG